MARQISSTGLAGSRPLSSTLLVVMAPGIMVLSLLVCAMVFKWHVSLDSIAMPLSLQQQNWHWCQQQQQQQQQHRDFWCSAYPATPLPVNLWYVKAPKAGSTTLTGVFNHMCTHYGMVWVKESTATAIMLKAWHNTTLLNASAGTMLREAFDGLRVRVDNHYYAMTSHMPYSQASAAAFAQPLWLFTSVRHPLARLYSHYMQDIFISAARKLGWRDQVDHPLHPDNFDYNATLWEYAMQLDTLESRWRYSKEAVAQNFLFQYLKGPAQTVEQVLGQYRFVFVVERMDESLVLFMLEFGLAFADIAYLPLKHRVGRYKTARDMPQQLNDAILGNNDLDLRLWQAANARLDRTRQSLEERCGTAVVRAALHTFQQLQANIVATCSDYRTWYARHGFAANFTYSGSANVASHSGAGYRCVRHVLRMFMAGDAA